jgi:hypothetical protein
MRLFGFLRHDRDRVDILERRLAILEASEEARTVAFLDIADRVKKYLSRVAAIDVRLAEREQRQHPTAPDAVTAALLRAKYPHSDGG